ncbi:DUF1330 domain-containing protein [Microbulbifer hainanensis]|uniref:DUF1330 domain-containing protein n=1 Tax=Microbulbifer hainanensis TaxID=2735675 RepID=UPI001867AE7D|nr:DUF1330 domain-containing protein [Microbulbifer hainanensis]
MKTIDPDPGKFAEALASIPGDQPVVMLNLLRFRDRAVYDGVESDCSGREAYQRYGEQAIAHLKRVGAELVWRGEARTALIAPAEEVWDEILLVRYPSIEKFVDMVKNSEYQQLAMHRTAALENARLIASLESGVP